MKKVCVVLILFFVSSITISGETLPPGFSVNGSEVINFSGVNTSRDNNEIILYTYEYGETTNTNEWGIEIICDSNGEVIDIREKGEVLPGGSVIPEYGFVISAHGTSEQYVSNIVVGDQITLVNYELIDLTKESVHEIDAVDPNEFNNPGGIDENGDPYPGYRGENQLLIYTSNYGSPTTGTNDYGYEIRVENGVVTEVGGNNSTITSDSYIISGHGEAANFLMNYAPIGTSVTYDDIQMLITFTSTPESLLNYQESEFNSLVLEYEKRYEEFYDIDNQLAQESIANNNNLITSAYEQLPTADDNNDTRILFLDTLDSIEMNNDNLYYSLQEPVAVEMRGLWHRPTECSLEEVNTTLQKAQDLGFNTIFLETFYNGYTIFPTSSIIYEQNPTFSTCDYGIYGNDLLQAFTMEAKNYDIEIHAWVEVFYVGYESNGQYVGNPIYEEHLDWYLQDYNMKYSTTYEGGTYFFLDPSNDEVVNSLLSLFEEILVEYDVEGLQLDYIRYPVAKDYYDWGYNSTSVNNFLVEENIDLGGLTMQEWVYQDPGNKATFEKWKQDNVTSFVEQVHLMNESLAEPKLISTAVFADLDEAINTKMQDWKLWVDSGYVDIAVPMAYYNDPKTVKTKISEMNNMINNQALSAGGIAPSYMGLSTRTSIEQIVAVNEAGSHGYIMFSSLFVLDDTKLGNALINSVNREGQVISPTSTTQEIHQAFYNDFVRKINDIYLRSGSGVDSGEMQQFLVDFNKCYPDDTTLTEDEILQQYLINLQNLLLNINYISNQDVLTQIEKDLQYLINIIDSK